MYTCTSKKNKIMRQIRKWNNKKSMTLYGSLIVYSTNTLEHYCQIVKILIRNLLFSSIHTFLEVVRSWNAVLVPLLHFCIVWRYCWIDRSRSKYAWPLSSQQSLTHVGTATTLNNRTEILRNIWASEWLLFIAKGASFQLYHGKNKLLYIKPSFHCRHFVSK